MEPISKWVGFPIEGAALGGAISCLYMLVLLWIPTTWSLKYNLSKYLVKTILVIEVLSFLTAYVWNEYYLP